MRKSIQRNPSERPLLGDSKEAWRAYALSLEQCITLAHRQLHNAALQIEGFKPEPPEPDVQPAAEPIPEGMITKMELARRLKKTIRTVENWQAKGIVPFIKTGRSVLFKWCDVEKHLKDNFRVCHLHRLTLL